MRFYSQVLINFIIMEKLINYLKDHNISAIELPSNVLRANVNDAKEVANFILLYQEFTNVDSCWSIG